MKLRGTKDGERSRELKRMRADQIVALYNRLSNITEHGVQKYTHEWIIGKLELRFFLVGETIEKIIMNHDKPEKEEVVLANQGKLFE